MLRCCIFIYLQQISYIFMYHIFSSICPELWQVDSELWFIEELLFCDFPVLNFTVDIFGILLFQLTDVNYFAIISSTLYYATEFEHSSRLWTIFDRFSVPSLSFSKPPFLPLTLSLLNYLKSVLGVLCKILIVNLTSWTKNFSDPFFDAMLLISGINFLALLFPFIILTFII